MEPFRTCVGLSGGSRLVEVLLGWAQAVGLVLGFLVLSLLVIRFWGRRLARRRLHHQLKVQAATLVVVVVALFLLVLASPLHHATKGQVLSLIGIVLSAMVALASPAMLSNAVAGLVLRWQRSFRHGDFLSAEGVFGRVAGIGLFRIEVQNEERDLVSIPNSVLSTKPFTVLRPEGTLISARVGLGYDVHHLDAEDALMEAARRVGLQDPFVLVEELGNFAVTYRVEGLLQDVKYYVVARSDLNRSILDTLHERGIEIMTPYVLAERSLARDQVLVPGPAKAAQPSAPEARAIEQIMFDLAEEAESLERLTKAYEELCARLDELTKGLAKAKNPRARESLERRIQLFQTHRQRLEGLIRERSKQVERDGEPGL